MNENNQKAVIYCRVASSSHGKSSLIAQETRCREYAKLEGYTVVEIFHEEGFSGNALDRPGINKMLVWLNENRTERPVIIVDDFTRIARDFTALNALNMAIAEAGGKLKSVSFDLGENEQAFLFTIKASQEKYTLDSRVTWLEKLKSMFRIFRTAAH